MILLLFFSGILINCHSQIINTNHQVIHDVDSIRKAFHIPGLAFGVANCDSILVASGLGIRQINTTDSVTVNDYFHT